LETLEAKVRALLQEGGVGFKTNTKSFILTCPRCSKKDKLYLRRNDGKFVCWYCREIDGFQGQPEYALAELCGSSVKEIRKALYGDEATRPACLFIDLSMADFEDDGEYMDVVDPLVPTIWPFEYYPLDHELSRKGVAYLESRGVPLEIAQQYGVRYCPSQLKVVFPVQHQGNLYGWQDRRIQDDQPYWDPIKQQVVKPLKTRTYENLKRDRLLMFMDRLEGSHHCVLAEGPFDALKAHLCGGNVATMGAAVTKAQLQVIRNSGIHKVYMALDPDAYLEINRLRKELGDMVLYDLRPPSGVKDIGMMSMQDVYKRFLTAEELRPEHVVIHLKDLFGAH